MNNFSKLWLKLAVIFDPVQYFFNGNLWEVFNKKFGDFKDQKVIDLACGTGELRRHITPISYLGVDINSAYIKYAKQNIKFKNTTFKVGDITKYKIVNLKDTVFFISAMHHLSDEQIKILFKNLRGGRIKEFIIVDDIPVGIFASLLSWLDSFLGGGSYFRSEKEIVKLAQLYFKVKDHGIFAAKRSFYSYPYVLLTLKNDN